MPRNTYGQFVSRLQALWAYQYLHSIRVYNLPMDAIIIRDKWVKTYTPQKECGEMSRLKK